MPPLHRLSPLALLLLSACGGSNAPSTPQSGVQTSLITPQPAHDTTVTSSHFSGSGNCESCHDSISGGFAHISDWRTSMMAQSSRDPLWQAKVASEVARNPGLQSTIEATCSRCHMPMANVQAEKSGQSSAILADGFLDPDHRYYDLAAEGVSCTLCHQIQDSPELGTEAGFDGGYSIGDNKQIYGPFTTTTTGPMFNQTNGFTPVHGAHVESSELCASCHNLTTPVVDGSGTPSGASFHEQSVYSEWAQSRYADPAATESCQSCHMPAGSAAVKVASLPPWLATTRTPHSHRIVGGNSQMLALMQQHGESLGVDALDFTTSIAAARAMLASAVDLTVSGLTLAPDGTLTFNVDLANKGGHKLPTSYPSRRAWVYVRIEDASGATLFESGATDAEGRISGADGDWDATRYEPHHDQVTRADQVVIYEAVMGNDDGEVNHTLLRSAHYLKENRLLPEGFNKNSDDPATATIGAAYNDADFAGGGDQIHYQLSGMGDAAKLVVEMRYQTLGYPFLADLFQDADNVALVARFKALFEATELRYETIASHTLSLE